MTLSGICISLRVVGNISRAVRDWDLSGYLPLEGFQHHLLELVVRLCAESFVSVVGEVLGLEADTGVKLHLEPLAGSRIDPLAVDALVLVIRPEILEFVQFKALALR